MRRSLILLFCIANCLSSCTKSEFVSAQTSYITRQNLASYHVGTPDPALCYPVAGQNLLIKWSLPTAFKNYSDLRIAATIRYRNHTENTLYIPIRIPSGLYQFCIRGDEFFQKGGILTYKVDLYGGGCLLYEWKHILWVEMIELQTNET